MYGIAKNTANYLAKSETLLNIALPKTLILGNISTYKRLMGVFLLHFYTSSRGSLARLRDTLSFCIYQTCVQICQRPTQAFEWGTIVPITHLVRRSAQAASRSIYPTCGVFRSYRKRSSIILSPKNSVKIFAELKTLCTFVSARILKSISDAVLYFIAKSRSAVSVSIQCSCQRKKGLRFFCVHTLTDFCFELWQEQTKVANWGIIVPRPHLVRRDFRNICMKCLIIRLWIRHYSKSLFTPTHGGATTPRSSNSTSRAATALRTLLSPSVWPSAKSMRTTTHRRSMSRAFELPKSNLKEKTNGKSNIYRRRGDDHHGREYEAYIHQRIGRRYVVP